jgi:hypothetical protein
MKVAVMNFSGNVGKRGLRRSGTKNRVSVYNDAPLMTSTGNKRPFDLPTPWVL